jgi:hypothetical protein
MMISEYPSVLVMVVVCVFLPVLYEDAAGAAADLSIGPEGSCRHMMAATQAHRVVSEAVL